MSNFKKYLVEFIGTFFLMFTIGCTAFIANIGPMAPFAIGFILMVMVYAGGPVSGGHYNPAVSLAAAIRGALEWKELLPYWLSQLIGAGAAALVILSVLPVAPTVEVANFDYMGLIYAEFLFTFALCFVVLSTATSKKVEGNSFFGFAIGATVIVGALAVGTISLGAFNPAVVAGLGIWGIAPMNIAIVTIASNLFGGIIAAEVFKMVNE